MDTLTKRILKSSWFKETYDFVATSQQTISEMNQKQLKQYNKAISEYHSLSTLLLFLLPVLEFNAPEQAEQIYETEQSKKYFPEEWEKYEQFKKEMKNLPNLDFTYSKKVSNPYFFNY